MLKKIILLPSILMLLTSIFCSKAFAATVSGYVLDKENGERIAYSSVMILGTHKGTLTNKEGYFVLNQVPAGKVEFFISHTS